MPTYDYECAACGHRLEAFQSFSEATLTRCPKCGKNRLERKIGSGAGILFKGSGFYQTDYKNAPSGGKDKCDAKPAPDKPAKDPAPGKGATDTGGASKDAAPAKPADTGSGGRNKGPDKAGPKSG